MAEDPRALAAELDRFADRLRRLERTDDLIDSIANGGLLTVPQAAAVCGISDQTLYRWLADAERRGAPLGLKRATWLIGTERLFDYVEKYQGGLPARVKAKNRLRERWPIWSATQE
ncbi:hypothetical protein ACVIW2_000281 [Bradyrhizobium huanghuaihaiense]